MIAVEKLGPTCVTQNVRILLKKYCMQTTASVTLKVCVEKQKYMSRKGFIEKYEKCTFT